MSRDGLVKAIAEAAHKRDATGDWESSCCAYIRDAEAILEAIEMAGWTVVPQEAAQALDDSAALDALTGPRNGRALTPVRARDGRGAR